MGGGGGRGHSGGMSKCVGVCDGVAMHEERS
jgi:hypothetical protein